MVKLKAGKQTKIANKAKGKSKKPVLSSSAAPKGTLKSESIKPAPPKNPTTKKIKAQDRKTIAIPDQDPDPYGDANSDSDGDSADGLDEETLAFFKDNQGAGFLMDIDKSRIGRTLQETERLHKIDKTQNPLPKQKRQRGNSPSMADLSDIESSDISSTMSDVELDSDLNSDLDGSDVSDLEDSAPDDSEGEEEEDEEDSDDLLDASDLEDSRPFLPSQPGPSQPNKRKRHAQPEEEAYDDQPRSFHRTRRGSDSSDSGEDDPTRGAKVRRLPIKLPGGEIQARPGMTVLPPKEVAKEDVSSDEEEQEEEEQRGEGLGLGQRWGRMAVADAVRIKNSAERKRAVKEQIASLGAEIVGGGELLDNIPLITRLSAFGLPTVPNPNPELPRIPNPMSVRALAIVSMMAVFKDIIPGYRIRELTELEQAEKVREEVRRQRDGEAGLVRAYAAYLKMLEKEIKDKSPLASLGIKCMCDLLSSVTHFNFRDNIMAVIVGRLSRKSWDSDSDVCLRAITSIFQSDLSSTHSLPLVRLLARMIKERKFAVHPNVLSCLWHVKVRAAMSKDDRGKPKRRWDKDRDWRKKAERGKGVNKGKEKLQTGEWADKKREWRTKKMRKDMRERKEIERDMEEAEAEVDEEEAGRNQTETLQHLFVLYFSILKQTKRTPLLPAALEGLARFAHLVNVDFFRDLLKVLRELIKGDKLDEMDELADEDEETNPEGSSLRVGGDKTRLRLLATVTAFELLSGQGEALNIDLSDFMTNLYGLIPLIAFDPRIEDSPSQTTEYNPSTARVAHKKSQLAASSDLFFRALDLIFFSPFASHSISPPWRAAAFAKRLLSASLYFPPGSALRAIKFVVALMVREPKVEALLASEDRTADGVWRGDVDDPQMANTFAGSFFEIGLLEKHWDESVRAEARKLGRFVGH